MEENCDNRVLLKGRLFFKQLSGWVLLGLGLWLHVYREAFAFTALLKDNPTHPVLIIDHVTLALIAVGGFVIVVSFLGCCGACTESVCFLGFVSKSFKL